MIPKRVFLKVFFCGYHFCLLKVNTYIAQENVHIWDAAHSLVSCLSRQHFGMTKIGSSLDLETRVSMALSLCTSENGILGNCLVLNLCSLKDIDKLKHIQ